MALQGQTQDYGLADILQILLQAMKDGWLHLENDLDEEVIATIQGGWVIAVESVPPRDSLLGRRLARNGLLTHAQLGAVLRRRAQTDRALADIVSEFGMVPLETIRDAATVVALDALFETFTWPRGTYKFIEGPVNPGPTWFEAVHVEHLLTNGIWLVDEWPEVREKTPSIEFMAVQAMELPAAVAGDGFADIFGGGNSDPSSVEDCERVVFELCQQDPIDAVLDRSPYDRFETLRCLVTLGEKGYLRFVNPSLPPPVPQADFDR